MNQVSVLFQVLVSIFAVSMIVMATGTLILRQLKQPIERIRCVQWTLAALLLALIMRHASLLPAMRWAVLPAVVKGSEVDENVAATTVDIESLASSTPQDSQNTSVLAEASPFSGTAEVASTGMEIEPQNRWLTIVTMWQGIQILGVVVALIGAAWLVSLLVIGWWRLRVMLGNCEPASDELLSTWSEHQEAADRGVRVYVLPSTSVPLTFGIRRPVIALPKRLAASNDATAISYCLSHEWAHVKSNDVATWLLINLMQPMLWFQPLYWHLRRELRTAQDQLADNFATRRTYDRTEYASLLMRFANQRINHGGNLALTMADRRSTIYRRIELLCNERLNLAIAARRRVVFGTVACLTMLAVGLGVLRLERATAAPVENDGTSVEENEDGTKATDANQPDATPQTKDEQKETDDETPAELSYSGFVLDKSNDKPINGATVVVRRMILKSYDRRILEESQHTTDASGKYTFMIPPDQTAEGSLYIELDVEHPDYAWKKGFGYALSMIRKNERLGERPFFSEVKLSPAEPITGRVVGPDDKPLAGVYIQSYSKSSADDFRDYGSFFKTKTEADGKFRLQMVKGGPSVFWVIPENHSPQQIISGTKRGDWGDISVKEGVSVKGQVVSATGEPLPGVWVNLEDQESQREIQMPVASSLNRTAKTNAKGEFLLSPMKPGKYQINVGNYPREIKFHEQRGTKSIDIDHVFVAQTIEIGVEDADRPFIVQAKPHIEFHGQYLNSKGESRSGHRVTFFGQFDGQWFHTDIAPDKDGKIFGKLPHGLTNAKMNAITNEHGAIQVRLKKDGPLMSGRQLDLGTLEDDVTGVEIIRYTAPIAQIKPVDEAGNSIDDCMVSGVYSDGDDEKMTPVGGMATNVFFEKQNDGRYRSSQMIPNRKIKFTAKKDGYEPASKEIELPEGEEQEIVLLLKKSAKPEESDESENDVTGLRQ